MHELNLMMSIWAPGAIFNIDQKTLTGKAQIRHWFATENKAFMPGHHWESDTPTYKIRVSLNGDKATMYFECHYIDPKTSTVVAQAGVTHTLQKVNGQWLITNSAGSTATLSPSSRMARPEVPEAPPSRRRRAALGGMKDRLVRLVARAPATLRTKLLVAFLAIAGLLVLVSVLGLQVLGQANARVERLDTLQLRSAAYQALEAHAGDLQQTLSACGMRARPR